MALTNYAPRIWIKFATRMPKNSSSSVLMWVSGLLAMIVKFLSHPMASCVLAYLLHLRQWKLSSWIPLQKGNGICHHSMFILLPKLGLLIMNTVLGTIVSDAYKVVVLTEFRSLTFGSTCELSHEIVVYSLKSNSWRKIGYLPFKASTNANQRDSVLASNAFTGLW